MLYVVSVGKSFLFHYMQNMPLYICCAYLKNFSIEVIASGHLYKMSGGSFSFLEKNGNGDLGSGENFFFTDDSEE